VKQVTDAEFDELLNLVSSGMRQGAKKSRVMEILETIEMRDEE